ncbi:hypothetical protein ACFWF3_31870, partial [Nocardia sp. NPDC060220]|uniref:hypothetical protein n=1 Tax=Nocardia sp. NPDC060220 TaxID=3347076 RepID=UPI00365C7B05
GPSGWPGSSPGTGSRSSSRRAGRSVVFYNDPGRLEAHLLEVSPADARLIRSFCRDLRRFTEIELYPFLTAPALRTVREKAATPYGNSGPRVDGYEIRTAAVGANIPCITTVQGAAAAVQGIEAGINGGIGVRSLQELHSKLRG